MFEQFTPESQRVLSETQLIAAALGHNYIGTEHVLLALLEREAADKHGPLTARGITLEAARTEVVEWLSHYVQDSTALAFVGVDARAVVDDARRNLDAELEVPGVTPRKVRRLAGDDLPPDARPLTPRVFKVLHLAVGIAAGSPAEPRQLLQALLEEDGGLAVVVLDRLQVDLAALHAELATAS